MIKILHTLNYKIFDSFFIFRLSHWIQLAHVKSYLGTILNFYFLKKL